MFFRVLLVTGLVSAGLLLWLMSSASPSEVGAVGVLGVFFLGYVTVLCFLTLLMWLVVVLLRRFMGKSIVARNLSSVRPKNVYYYSTVISLAPIILISLNSVGGVSIYGLMLVFLFVALGCVYVSKRTA